MNGVFGKYLHINLSNRNISTYPIPDEWVRKHIGGRGIAGRILLKELKKGVDPLSPENLLIFSTGPLQGTGVAGSGRYLVMAKSPKTNNISDSYVGGFLAHELGTSGYDGIIIEGKASTPVYLVLNEGEVDICDASGIWGMKTADVEDKLKQGHGEVKVASIGPAGEKLVKFACIISDKNRAAGRPGFGAVMGSKNLKAIVIKGGKEKKLFDENKFSETRKRFTKELATDQAMQSFGKYGTAGDVNRLNELGILPTKNFKEGLFEYADKISGERMYDTILVGRDTCTGCPVRCKRVVEGEFQGEKITRLYGGPEYETVAAFGSCCLNHDLESIALANQKCNAYGLDTISTGVTIAFAMEASEKGLIKEKIKWGDGEAIVELIDKIALREGIGDLLSLGIDKVSAQIGADFAMEIKNQELPLHEPRGKKGLAISYATSPRGATHLEAIHDGMLEGIDSPTPEMGVTEPVDRLSWKDKARLTKVYEDLYSFSDSVIICGFVSWSRSWGDNYPYADIREMVSAATGLEIDKEEMARIAERNYLLRKIMAGIEGYKRKDDKLPKRFENPLPRGGSKGESIPNDELQKTIDEYYELRGFDSYGPTDQKLAELDLEELQGLIQRE